MTRNTVHPPPAARRRSAHQLEFHEAFLRAAARVIYRGEWETSKPMIMRRHGWDQVHSEVMIRCPLSLSLCIFKHL